MRCAYPACVNDTSHALSREISFYRLPQDTSLRTAWIMSIGKPGWEPELGTVICSRHFQADDLVVTMHGCYLRNGAIPNINKDNHRQDNLKKAYCMKLCRICFVTDSKLYPMKTFKMLNEAYETLTGYSVADAKSLPPYLCTECADRLMNSARFRHRSLRAHVTLMEILRKYGCITQELLHSVMETDYPRTGYITQHEGMDNIERGDKLEEVYRQTQARDDTTLDYIEINDEVGNIKPEVDDEADQSLVDNEDGISNIVIDKVKTEYETFINQNNNISNSPNINDDVDNSDSDKDNHSSSGNPDAEGIDYFIANNEVINHDNFSVCANFNEDNVVKTVHNDVTDENVKSEVLNSENIICDGVLYEEIVSYVTRLNYSDVVSLFRSEDEEFSWTELHSFIFVGEDCLPAEHSLEVKRQKVKLTRVKMKELNRLKVNEYDTEKTDAELDNLRCDICSFTTVDVLQLLDHLKAHGLTNTLGDMDNKNSQTKKKSHHVRKKSGKKPHICNICHKICQYKSLLDKHMVKHTRMKPYSCKLCNKSFGWKHKLRKHIQTPSCGIKCCDVCGQRYLRSDHFRRHLQTHYGEKPYSQDSSSNVC